MPKTVNTRGKRKPNWTEKKPDPKARLKVLAT
jgi:hypothetical protein